MPNIVLLRRTLKQTAEPGGQFYAQTNIKDAIIFLKWWYMSKFVFFLLFSLKMVIHV